MESTVQNQPPEREPLPPVDTWDETLIHHNPDLDVLLTSCGVSLEELPYGQAVTGTAGVTCGPCLRALASQAEAETPEPVERRTVSLEVLTDELRATANAAIAAEFRKYDREPELLPPESRAAVVVRRDGQLHDVTDVDTDVPQRNGAEALAWLMHQALGRANNLDAELLMPPPDVLAALEGRDATPVGSEPTRENYVAGLRALAGLIESTPDLPVPKYRLNVSAALDLDGVEQAAAALGVEMVTETAGDNVHYRVERKFGPVDFALAHVAFGAAKDLTPGQGEVAGPVEGAGPATAPPEPEQAWWFTFGWGQEHANHYVVFWGTYDSARDEMMARFGNRWAHQYATPEAAGVDEYKLVRLPESQWPPRRETAPEPVEG